jgi:hypothetical protein
VEVSWLLPSCMEARDERCLRALQKHLDTVKLLIVDVTFPGFVQTGSSSLALCLFGADIAEGGILVHEFSFESTEATFHRHIVETISPPAHG